MSIHQVGDGLGPRVFTVNGKSVRRVFYADTRKGFVDYYPHPYKLNRWKKRIISRRLRGNVEVRHIDTN